MTRASLSARLIAALAMALPMTAGPVAARPPAPGVPVISPKATRHLLERVADWQLQHLSDFSYLTPVGRTPDRRGWVQGVFWLGLSRFASQPGEARFARRIDALGTAEHWRIGDRKAIADDQLVGQVWLARFAATRDPAMIAPLRADLDRILANPPRTPLTWGPRGASGALACLPRWCWADALFMAPATWAGLSQATGNPAYLAYAVSELGATADLLYEPEERLFYRDSRFIAQRGAGGARIFWSRGNGWVLAGLANMLRVMPANSPERARIAAIFSAMAGRIAGLQRADGSWPTSLLEPDQPAGPETSGGALFVYAMAWGVKAGLLDPARFDAPIRHGWMRLVDAVAPDGRVGWVQPIGDAPHSPQASDTQLYGSGAVLLAGSALLDLYRGGTGTRSGH